MSASQQTVGGEVSLTRNERLDRLPFNKAHRKLLVASGIGWRSTRWTLVWCRSSWPPSRRPAFQSDADREKLGAVHRFRRNGDRRRAWRLRGRPRWPQDGLLRDAGDFRPGQWRYGVVMVAGGSADRSTGHRPRPGRRAAGRLHIGLGILSDQTTRPYDGAAGILLGNRLDHRRLHRLFRHS